MTELRPCPMCGGVPTLFPTGVSPEAWVLCKHCGTGGPTTSDTTRAAKKWNTRPAEDELLDALEDDVLPGLNYIDDGQWDEWTGNLTLREDEWGAIRECRDALKALLAKHRPEKKP